MIRLCIVIAITLAATSFTNSYDQSNEFPPIQKFLDKIEGHKFEENMTYRENISQLLTATSFTWTSVPATTGKSGKRVYSNIDWNEFSGTNTYWLKNADKYIQIGFTFNSKIKISLYSEDEEYFTSNNKYEFFCIILAKDKEAFLKVVNDWKEARKK